MKVLVASNAEAVTDAVVEVLKNSKSGCTEMLRCAVEQAPEQVAQHRPDVVVIEVGPVPELAWEATVDLQETYPVRVVAVGPSSDSQTILQTLNAGAYKYVDTARVMEDLPVALRRARAEAPLTTHFGRVISVMGASGGCGASTIAANMAAAYCHGDKRALLVDLNLEGGDLAALLRVQPSHSIADFCQNASRMDASMFDKCLVSQKSGLALLPPPLRYQEISRVTVRGVRKAITMARSRFPYVVVDVDRTYRSEHAQALFQSDVVVVVVRLDFPSVRQAGHVFAYLDDLGIDPERVRLVVNRTTPKSELREQDVESALKMRIYLTIPEGARHLGRAVQRGVPLVADRPRSPVAQTLSRLAASLNGRL